jgi:2'-hydroxyisoflavone reductase
MNVLVLGGTIFLGRHLVETLLARGHAVTLFNRGQHNPDLFPQVEKLRGDRKETLEPLRGRTWDAAVDTCGYVPRVVKAAAEALAGAVGHYTFISSISVYADFKQPGITEDYPLGTLEDETGEEVTGETYGPLKALCEQAAERALPGRVLNVRPSLIVGPHDPTYRFTYWPARVARGGEVLAPGSPEAPVQVVDVRDLAEWTVRALEAGRTGPYNVTGPPTPMGEVLQTCRTVSGSDVRFTWVDEAFLLEHEVKPWSDLPLWVPEQEGWEGFSRVDSGKAVRDGLTFRPLTDTVRDTLEWDRSLPEDFPRPAGLPPEREAELLMSCSR